MSWVLLAAFVSVCVYAGLGATAAHAGIAEPPEQIPASAAEPVAPADSEVASTDQSASADASATQEQPTNVVVSVRINSPGDDGPISQRNVVVGVSDAANDASTKQGGTSSEGAVGSANQDASTNQQAGSTATATQHQPTNVVVIVRINSPGDNGSISQGNVDVAGASAGNESATAQGGSGGTAGASSTPVAPPKRQQPARNSARAPKRRPARDPAHVAPRKNQPAAAGSSVSGPAATTPGSSYGSAASSANPRSGVTPRTAKAPASERRHAKAARRASSAGVRTTVPRRLAGGAANLLDSLTPPIQTTAPRGSASVSGSVVYSLLVVLAAVAAFLAWPHVSRRLQLPGPRGWRG